LVREYRNGDYIWAKIKMKKVAILQSNYIPWKGYFDIINSADEFIIFDDAQFTKNDWRNRNRIKSLQGVQWITIPVIQKTLSQKINETRVFDKNWGKKHWNTLKTNYSKATCFSNLITRFEDLYLSPQSEYLTDINKSFILRINEILGIQTKISDSRDYTIEPGKTDRLISLVKQAGGDEYLTGPAAKDYLEEEKFTRENIKVSWMDYSGYPVYSQIHPPFEHFVSILDLLFNQGDHSNKYMKSFEKV
jgi:hypothetical protein